mgnify:CR=1 FL=1
MRKNYVENSLKRFLKRKMKITMGVVVSFLITGAVAFGVEITDIPKGYEDRVIVGEQTEVLENINDIFTLKIDGKEETASLFVLDGAVVFNDKEINSYASNGNPQGKVYVKDAEFDNHGWINMLTLNGGKVINNGKIVSDEANGHWVTYNPVTILGDNPIFINGENGIIRFRNYGVNVIYGSKNAEIYNYGLIQGIPKPNGFDGHYNIALTKNANSKIYNYGKIIGSMPISISNDTTELNTDIFYNYGYLISTNSALVAGYTEGFTLKNYGTIKYKDKLYTFSDNVNKDLPYNFENRGVMFRNLDTSEEKAEKFVQRFDNNGILFTNSKSGTFSEAHEVTGAVLDKDNFSLLNGGNGKNGDNTVKDMSKETEINSTNTADNMFINNSSLTLNLGDKVTGKTITTVSQAKGNVVLDNDIDGDKVSGNNNLTLDNTSIIGYFEKDGTLLKVDGNLTLTGNSIINAVAARDENGDILKDVQNVVAVDVFGKLTYTEGESHIFGTIKGGEGSKIVVNGTETTNPNELTETLSSSGNIYLNGQKWTKGETGSIELTGGTVHIDDGNGTLVGYLAKEENPTTKAGENVLNTTLDGMITGKGTLNVNEIRFDLGNLEINNMEDTYKVNGNKDIAVQDALNKINVSGIFKKEIKDGNLILSLKSAEEMGIHDPSKQKEYEELVKNFKDSEEFYNLVNTGNAEAIRNHLNVIDAILELLGTAGVKITRDLTGAFTDAVVEFDKKANKGEWLTNAKYIGSDMEYDGTKHINGYDSDIKSMIGMAEYGITENTSLGFALGGGDTEVDLKTLNGKSTSFDGKNYYAGIYAKHSMNGFDMIGSLGYTISDLDVEKGGSADSEAITLAGYIKKDVYVTDTVKLEPNLSFTYDYIMQDKAEMGEGMTIDSGDSHVFEAGAGLNLVKEFALEKGSLKLKTGVKYSMTNIERNKDVTGKFYNADVNLGSPDIDDKEGKAHVGFDYEHETGFGVNGKYEMMWSDSGDDSRITAGISYRF